MAQEREDLAAAFRRFAPDRNRFLKEFASSSGQAFSRYAPEFEYEIKFRPLKNETGIDKLLNRVVSNLKWSDGWVPTNYRSHSLKKPRYYTKGNVEYSTFVQGGEQIQKIKQHQVLEIGGIAVMKSLEAETTDQEAIIKNLDGANYIGKLRKERVKTYLLHLPSKTAYSLAVTEYSVGQDSRIQCELEYAGHLTTGKPAPSVSERALLLLLSQRGQSVVDHNPGRLQVERETKLEFLIRSTGESEELSA